MKYSIFMLAGACTLVAGATSTITILPAHEAFTESSTAVFIGGTDRAFPTPSAAQQGVYGCQAIGCIISDSTTIGPSTATRTSPTNKTAFVPGGGIIYPEESTASTATPTEEVSFQTRLVSCLGLNCVQSTPSATPSVTERDAFSCLGIGCVKTVEATPTATASPSYPPAARITCLGINCLIDKSDDIARWAPTTFERHQHVAPTGGPEDYFKLCRHIYCIGTLKPAWIDDISDCGCVEREVREDEDALVLQTTMPTATPTLIPTS